MCIEKQIEEMAYSSCPMPKASTYITSCDKCGMNKDCIRQKHAKEFYAAGYRKQSDVIKEFVEKVKDKFFYDIDSERSINPVSIYRFTDKEIDELATEFGAEVEK